MTEDFKDILLKADHSDMGALVDHVKKISGTLDIFLAAHGFFKRLDDAQLLSFNNDIVNRIIWMMERKQELLKQSLDRFDVLAPEVAGKP